MPAAITIVPDYPAVGDVTDGVDYDYGNLTGTLAVGCTPEPTGLAYYTAEIPTGLEYSAIISFILFQLQNVLSLIATIGQSPTFSRGGSKAYVPAWDATAGLLITEIPADGVASPGMRYAAGAWYNDDGAGNSLHPINSDGVFIVHPAWADATVYGAGAYSVDFVGDQAKYYLTVAGGTSSGTGVADDTGVVWVLQGNYSNLGGGTLPRLLAEGVGTNVCADARDFEGTGWTMQGTPTFSKDSTGVDGVANAATTITDDSAAANEVALYAYTRAGGLEDTFVIYVGKTVTAATFPAFGVAGTNRGIHVVNTDNGTAVESTSPLANNVVSALEINSFNADFWELVYTYTAINNSAIFTVYPAVNTDAGTALTASTVGSCVFDFADIRLSTDRRDSLIFTDGVAVQRNASVESSTHIFTAQFIRFRVADIGPQTYLTDATNSFDYDLATTTLTFTDGVTTLTTITALVIGDTVVLDQVAGKLYVNGVLKDTDALLAPTWGAITGISNITDLIEETVLDPTDITWDK